MTKRIKAQGYPHRLDVDIAVDRITYAQNEMLALELRRDAIIQRIKEKYAVKIAALELEINLKAGLCEKYAEEHRAELLPDETKSKSAETALARFGFRMGNRTVVLLNKKCSWDAAVKLLKRMPLLGCVRTVEEVNKEAVLAQTDDKGILRQPITEKDQKAYTVHLDLIGLKIKQTETFFIEPKAPSAETVKAGAA